MKTAAFLFATLILFGLTGGAPGAWALPSLQEGMPITAIELKTQTNLEQEEFHQLVTLRVGEPYIRDRVSQAVKALYKKGLFSDIKVDAVPFQNGIKLTFVAEGKLFLGRYLIRGNRRLSRSAIRSYLDPRPGEEFSEHRLQRSLATLVNRYRQQGHHQVRIDYHVIRPPRGQEVMVQLEVQEGTRLLVEDIQVSGNRALNRSVILRRMTTRAGQPFNSSALERDVQRLLERYRHLGYLTAEIPSPAVTSDPSRHRVAIHLTIREGPLLLITFSGNRHIPARRLRPFLSITEEGSYSQETLQGNLEAMLASYRELGYHFAQGAVKFEPQQQEEEIRIHFQFQEGPRVKISRIDMQGNQFLTIPRLRAVLASQTSGLFSGGWYRQSAAEADVKRLTDLYRKNGFLQAQVQVQERFTANHRQVELTYAIQEGPQTRIGTVQIRGNLSFPEEQIRQLLSSKAGSPLNEEALEGDLILIKRWYATQGYLSSGVQLEQHPWQEDRLVDIGYTINEGPRTTIGGMQVRGNLLTKRRVISREIPARTGEPFNMDALLHSRQRLNQLGIFNRVRIEPGEERPGPARDVIVEVEEGKPKALDLGVGYGSEDRFRGVLELAHHNIGGTNRQLSLRGEASAILRKASLTFREPWLFNLPLSMATSLEFKEDLEKIAFSTRTAAGQVNLEKRLTRHLNAGLSYRYDLTEIFDVDPNAVLGEEDLGHLAVSSLTPRLTYNTKDDPFNPSTGSFNELGVKYSHEAIGSGINMVKVRGESRWFYSLLPKVVVAASAQGGIAQPLGGTVVIPIVERFFTGGASTVRGYRLNEISPLGPSGSPVGGTVFAVFNLEIRFPLYQQLGAVTFGDFGNVWRSTEDSFSRLKASSGFGLRYTTPIGPLRLDFGYKLTPEPEEDRWRLHFTIGHTF